MKGEFRSASVLVAVLCFGGCGAGAQWVAQTPESPQQTCTINADLELSSPANNSVGVSTNGLTISVTTLFDSPVPMFFAQHVTVTVAGSNGTTSDLQLTLTSTSPIRPFWAALLPQPASRTFYVVSRQGQPSQLIGCFTTQ